MAEKQGRWGAWAQRLLCPATKSKKCLGSTWRTIVFKPWQCDYRLGVADRTQAPAGTNHDANWEGQGTPALDAEHSTSLHWCQIESWTWSFGWSRKNSFIALPGKGGHSGLLPFKTALPTREDLVRSFYTNSSRAGLLIRLECVQGLRFFNLVSGDLLWNGERWCLPCVLGGL